MRALSYGGRLVIDGGNLGMPTTPSTDSNTVACLSPTTGNIGDPGDPEYTEYLWDAEAGLTGAVVCARVNSTGVRVLVPLPSGSGTVPLSVDWEPDPGTPG